MTCQILDLSETGALLRPLELALCPNKFVLKPRFDPSLECEVVWRKGEVLGVRALEEGLRPQREFERYRQYKSALRSIEPRLKVDGLPSERIAAMIQLEQISFEEMVNFLKDHDESRYVM
jgi:hypothetical protein